MKLSFFPQVRSLSIDDFWLEPAFAEVSIRGIDVLSRAKSVKAKRSELEDLFGSLLWNVLKARWLLKWSKHSDGSDRAKTRLVLQGFSGPDAITGPIATTSPSDLLLGRELVFDLGCLKKVGRCGVLTSRPLSCSPLHRPDDPICSFPRMLPK